MKMTMLELAGRYNIPVNIVSDALISSGMEQTFIYRDNVLQLAFEEDSATEAIGSYIAKKVHETYKVYEGWEKCAKRFDARILGKPLEGCETE